MRTGVHTYPRNGHVVGDAELGCTDATGRDGSEAAADDYK